MLSLRQTTTLVERCRFRSSHNTPNIIFYNDKAKKISWSRSGKQHKEEVEKKIQIASAYSNAHLPLNLDAFISVCLQMM